MSVKNFLAIIIVFSMCLLEVNAGILTEVQWSIYRATYIFDGGRSGLVKVDHEGNIIWVGTTANSNHETTTGAYQPKLGGLEDVFITKMSPEGKLIWSTLFGGSGVDSPFSMAIDNQNNIWVGGHTTSSNLPTTANTYCPYNSGGSADGMLFKISRDGQQLLYSSYIGTSSMDGIIGMACDSKDNVWACGRTFGKDLKYTINAPQKSKNAYYDGFYMCINEDYSTRVVSYWGYNSDESLEDVAIDNYDQPVFTGFTMSTDIPFVGNTFQKTNGGERDILLFKMNPTTFIVEWSTLVGGCNDDMGHDVAVDKDNNINVSGFTSSPNLPISANAAYTTLKGKRDFFVTQFSNDGLRKWTTYIGGSQAEGYEGWKAFQGGIATDNSGNIFIGGSTLSTDFPIIEPYQNNNNGDYDAFVAEFDKNGNHIGSTYLGSSGCDDITKVIVLQNGNLAVTGHTNSYNFPTTDSISKAQYNGCYAQCLTVFGKTDVTDGHFDISSLSDSCLTIIHLSITSKYKFDYSIINSTNAHIEETYRDDLKIIFDISAINPWSKVFWTIEYKDVYGNTNTVSDSLGISSLYSFRVPTQYIDFDTVQTNQVFIKHIMLYNDADISIEINEPTLLFNSVFSLSSSDFPLTIPAHDSAQIKIYYAPATSYRTDRDTLYIASPCNKQVIPLSGFAETTDYTVETRCGLEITNSTKPIGYTHNKVEILPNPIIGSGTIKVYGDGKAKVKISIYDETGRIVRDLYQGIIDKSTEIPFKTGNLPTGLYLAVVDIEGEIFQKVFFINK